MQNDIDSLGFDPYNTADTRQTKSRDTIPFAAPNHGEGCYCLTCRNARVTSDNPHGWPFLD
jgi:hypothetical protein